jgi:hypothetical protein
MLSKIERCLKQQIRERKHQFKYKEDIGECRWEVDEQGYDFREE